MIEEKVEEAFINERRYEAHETMFTFPCMSPFVFVKYKYTLDILHGLKAPRETI
jgi:hypothetical protein